MSNHYRTGYIEHTEPNAWTDGGDSGPFWHRTETETEASISQVLAIGMSTVTRVNR